MAAPGWMTTEQFHPYKQPTYTAIGGGPEVTFKQLVPRLSVREGASHNTMLHSANMYRDSPPFCSHPSLNLETTQSLQGPVYFSVAGMKDGKCLCIRLIVVSPERRASSSIFLTGWITSLDRMAGCARPIIVQFTSYCDRNRFFMTKKLLKNTGLDQAGTGCQLPPSVQRWRISGLRADQPSG
ncbi:hypothetical protein J6590_056198 [Homalodisca vitripennis]|nr:hypothetical protein J6590_056198 [Homalodisca vitripennis]